MSEQLAPAVDIAALQQLLHSDPAGKMLGFECSSFMLQAVAKAVANAKKFREEAGL